MSANAQQEIFSTLDAAYVEELETKFRETTQALYRASGRKIQPLYPWVLVRLLDRQQSYKGVIALPEKQNKVVLEGIVVAIWRPFFKTLRPAIAWKPRSLGPTTMAKEVMLSHVEMKSDLNPGDRVLFQHWAGQPVHGLDDQKYRFVRERDWSETKDGGIMAKVETETNAMEAFAAHLEELSGAYWHLDREELRHACERFLIIDRQAPSVTLSGK